jgi:hypothetical protein
MDPEVELETQLQGANVLTEGEAVSLLDNDFGYLGTADLTEVRVVELLPDFAANLSLLKGYRYDLPEGSIPISANGEAYFYCEAISLGGALTADLIQIFPSFFESGEVGLNGLIVNPFVAYPIDLEIRFYYSYITP